MKVLIVDDNDQSLYLLRSQLEHAGHEVWPAGDGAEALAVAGKQTPDAIISDILMPRLDGFALCRAVREDAKLADVPVILYSATYTDLKDRAFGLSLGADRYLEKPTDVEDLLHELDAVIEERREGRTSRPAAPLEEHTYLREYNARLVRKLEDRMLALERSYRELAESERRYHELFDVASDVIFTLDPEGNISLVNRRVLEMLGYHTTELVGRPFEPLVSPSHRSRARESIQQALSGQRRTLELEFMAADGRILAMHVVTVPLWQGQRPTGLMGIARDFGDRAAAGRSGPAAATLEHWASSLREAALAVPEGSPGRERLLTLAAEIAGGVHGA